MIAAVPGVTDRDAAEALRGQSLYVPRERLPATDEDEYYHEDLVGLAARDAEGRELGKVVAVLNYGAGDILEIATGDGRSELVPFTRAAVPAVDLAARTVEVVAAVTAPWTATVLTIFPEMFPGPLGVVARRPRAASASCGGSSRSTCAASPPTGTRPSTTRRSAAVPAW